MNLLLCPSAALTCDLWQSFMDSSLPLAESLHKKAGPCTNSWQRSAQPPPPGLAGASESGSFGSSCLCWLVAVTRAHSGAGYKRSSAGEPVRAGPLWSRGWWSQSLPSDQDPTPGYLPGWSEPSPPCRWVTLLVWCLQWEVLLCTRRLWTWGFFCLTASALGFGNLLWSDVFPADTRTAN